MKKINKSFKKICLILVLIFLIGGFFILMVHVLIKPSFEEIMVIPTKQLNETADQMIDKETRFDSGEVLPNKAFRYNFTLVNTDSTTVNVEDLKKSVEEILLQRIKTDQDPDLKILRSNNATIIDCYRDRFGNILFTFSFTPEQYKD